MNPNLPESLEAGPEKPAISSKEDDPPAGEADMDGGLCGLLAKSAERTDRPKIQRLVVIDNHELFREGMLRLLVMEGDFAPVTGAFADARPLVQHFWPDLILFCIGPVRERGIELATALRIEYPRIRLVLLDETVRTRHVREALVMNADGYWTKHANFSKIIQALRAVVSGGQSFCPEVERHLRKTPAGLRFDPPHAHPEIAMLTPPEAELFLLLAEGHSIDRVAEKFRISEKQAESRRAGLMRKLRVHEIADLTRLAITEGLLE
jgi:two-component system, NarL family, response regulator DegU